jgi:hypothetical protein
MRSVLDTTLCDKVLSLTCDRSVVFSEYTNKTDSHDIIEIFVESGLNHHKPNQTIKKTFDVLLNDQQFIDLGLTYLYMVLVW